MSDVCCRAEFEFFGGKGLMLLRRKDLVVSRELWWDMRVW